MSREHYGQDAVLVEAGGGTKAPSHACRPHTYARLSFPWQAEIAFPMGYCSLRTNPLLVHYHYDCPPSYLP
eukprot:scaffold78013_cov37-Tisochrysis_lutea.AAC.3